MLVIRNSRWMDFCIFILKLFLFNVLIALLNLQAVFYNILFYYYSDVCVFAVLLISKLIYVDTNFCRLTSICNGSFSYLSFMLTTMSEWYWYWTELLICLRGLFVSLNTGFVNRLTLFCLKHMWLRLFIALPVIILFTTLLK